MAEPYTSPEAGALGLIITQFAGCAQLQTLAGGDATAARGRIVEWDGGEDPSLGEDVVNCLGATIAAAAPLLVITAIRHPAERIALDTERRDGEAQAVLYLATAEGLTAPEQGRRALNVAGALRSQFFARFATSGCLYRGTIGLEGPFLPDPTSAWRDCLICTFDLRWRA